MEERMQKEYISQTKQRRENAPDGMGLRRALALMVAALAAQILTAVPTIEIKSVAQRWPWNNKLDITYEVTDGQDVAKNVFRRLLRLPNSCTSQNRDLCRAENLRVIPHKRISYSDCARNHKMCTMFTFMTSSSHAARILFTNSRRE